MSKLTIITNNPDVAFRYSELSNYLETDVFHILVAVRARVHSGARILSHPLSSSIKPNESPYKSILISLQKGRPDTRSLQLIEDAIITLKKLAVKELNSTESILEDYRVIDLDIINSAMAALNIDYNTDSK